MADDKIGYQYEILFDGISQMQGVNREVEQLIQTLSQETGRALDTWSGPAAANYNELSLRIEKNFGDMNTIVHDLAKELKIRADDMKQQDIRSGNRFGR
ncbi:WXG100 family type VII secretion target [Micromonospora sp. NBC_01813]|uniref:WXG100 family type VII secretion target n=1 Tax=Micromonospora sp. NBC_01813 TaxID=2975988 RepID=UPI002DD87174|nr:WXG100 family type VII secretion target [Micromonospora sp. NBC_01813]WSA07733.1 WXG100 family type VII secretion target [Micromonospora sp. NBC_01813]